jgi:hypothetical protein
MSDLSVPYSFKSASYKLAEGRVLGSRDFALVSVEVVTGGGGGSNSSEDAI